MQDMFGASLSGGAHARISVPAKEYSFGVHKSHTLSGRWTKLKKLSKHVEHLGKVRVEKMSMKCSHLRLD